MKKLTILFAVLAVLSLKAADTAWVSDTYRDGDFKLAQGVQLAPVCVAPGDSECVRLAAHFFAEDVERVTGHKPVVVAQPEKPGGPAVIIGTLGQSPLIDRLVAGGKLDAKRIQGQWESFLITEADGSLVIAGSDRRGTAYGVFELSRAIGVSPWCWWADVAPDHRDNLFVAAGTRKFGPPSVQYRGIFINDEDWGLQPWAAKTFEPEVGNFGPKTYAKVCELLLRLKANTLWPAMHECSTPFNAIPENKVVADRYGIVMGSSHCEPLLRNNVGEWPKDSQADFNFLTNPRGVTKYWEERLQTNGKYENLYTIGMRGIHDGPMQGPRGKTQIIDTLERIFGVQRSLLARYVNADPAKVPQIFCPYKELLDYFLDDLKVPPDVTVVFPDDNFGYIRYFPTPEQIAERPGGFGVYYHISYLGGPLSYVWLNTTPPALIWEEMSKAYEHGMQKFWILNVGDLKPGEIGVDFFLQMAWDVKKWNLETLPDYLNSFAAEQFGPARSREIAGIMDDYYRLGYQRKPEHLQWYVGREPPRPSDFSYTDYSNEGKMRLEAYEAIENRVWKLEPVMPAAKKDAFFELVEYPVLGAGAANRRFLAGEMAALGSRQGRANVRDWIGVFDAGTANLTAAATRFDDLAAGKWRNVMEDDPLLSTRSYRNAALSLAPAVARFAPPAAPGIGVAIEGRAAPLQSGETAALPPFDPYRGGSRFLDVFKTGATSGDWTLRTDSDWIELDRADPLPVDLSRPRPHSRVAPGREAQLSGPGDFTVSVDWSRVPRGEDVFGSILIAEGKASFRVEVPVFNPPALRPRNVEGTFVESGGVVSILAGHYSRKTDRPGAAWRVIPGLGRTGDSVAVFPTTAPSVDPSRVVSDAPVLEYDITLFHAGEAVIRTNLIPTQPLRYGMGLRFAVAVDNEAPRLVTISAGVGDGVGSSRAWQENVLDNTTTATIRQTFASAGAHTLKIYMVDPGVLLEKVVIDIGGLRPSYLGPPETLVSAFDKLARSNYSKVFVIYELDRSLNSRSTCHLAESYLRALDSFTR